MLKILRKFSKSKIPNAKLIEPLILTENQLPKNLHSHLLLAVSFIPNRLIYSPKIGTSPYEALFNKGPDASPLLLSRVLMLVYNTKGIETKIHNYMEEGRSKPCYCCIYSQSIHLIR